jgi:hypothetical protein
VAKGSEQFTFKRHADIPRDCGDCDKPLRVKDVAEVLELPLAYFRCRECFERWTRGGATSQREFYLGATT